MKKFAQLLATNESQDAPLNTDKVVSVAEEAVEKPEAEAPAGLTEENVDPNPAATTAEQATDLKNVATDDAINNAEDDELQVAEATQEVVDTNTQVEEQAKEAGDYINAAQKLDELQAAANSSSSGDESGLTKFGAQMIEQSMESIYRGLNLERPTLPVMEAFGSKWSQNEATRLTLEALNNSSKSMMTRVIDSMKALLSTVMNFIAGLVKNRALMEAHVRKLLARASAITGQYTAKKDHLKGSFVKGLSYHGHADNMSHQAVLESSGVLVAVYGEIVNAIQSLRDAKSLNGDVIELTEQLIEKSFSGTEMQMGNLTAYGAFAGGKSLVIGASTSEMISYVNNTPMGRSAPETMPAQDPKEIVRTLTAALELIKDLRQVEAKSARLRDAVNGLIRRVQEGYSTLRATLGNDEHAQKVKDMKDLRCTQELLSKMIARFPTFIFSAVKYTCDRAVANLNNLETT